MTQGFGSSMKTPAIPAGRFIKQQHKSTVNCKEFNAARQIDINKKPISTTTPVNTINSRQLQFKQQYNFRNDQPARKRKALFIGINYFGTSNALRGNID
jgi:hypothetical protein